MISGKRETDGRRIAGNEAGDPRLPLRILALASFTILDFTVSAVLLRIMLWSFDWLDIWSVKLCVGVYAAHILIRFFNRRRRRGE